MIKIDVKAFLDMQDMLVQFSIVVGSDERNAKRLLAKPKEFVGYIRRLIDEMRAPEFSMCRKSAERLADHIAGGLPAAQILHDVNDLRGRLLDQVDSVCFLALSARERDYFDPPHLLFGDDVELKFQEMSEDITEAGKCLALDRATAAVFHLMRIMEKALQRLGAKLGVALVAEKNWQNILDEMNKTIKALDHKLPRTKALAEANAHLYAVKVAWRNEVMHPKQAYTLAQAEEIYRNVETFVRDLARLI